LTTIYKVLMKNTFVKQLVEQGFVADFYLVAVLFKK